ncbi:MAG: YebC/PmpR family DNA-binding transcriptional regulator [Clostridia bacterium]|nr:YebC/PmpR family DNA-binding transcriptional regulator [Clostridia bacterium]MDD3093299.1 YebC/PmpR family DNA-binding transcriptional regulator [Clostridia bacterium]MDD3970317.1 YebC/PmpR family DNA-binding transcriptional regulator [Clostridia bacterium]MDD4542842.1 YebC/PmpR family DNA-binding transcriptional regulator [Clostridia bacterium]HPJ75587.1 YebC/PmpR family DNA-binding transcriptional regulator [Clostridia bacterium]
MSGHSKWANIKHKKERSDSSRGKLFTKIGREIMVAVKSGGPDPNANSRLRDVIAKAKSNNVPNDTIAKSIKKASGEGNAENYDQITYEGYGPNGVAVIVETMTDNRNRTASDVRHYFDKFGGNLGTNGCVSYLFDKKGVIVIEDDGTIDADQLMMEALEAGAEDFENEDEMFEITCDPAEFSALREALETKGYNFLQADLQMIPQTYVKIDEDKVASMEKLIDNLDDLDDVQNIYHNWEQE